MTAGTKSFSHTACQIWNKLPKDAQISSGSPVKDFKTLDFQFIKDQKPTI